MSGRPILPTVLLTLISVRIGVGSCGEPEPVPPEVIDRYVQQLGSPRPQQRAEAVRWLSDTPAALPAVRLAAVRSPDPEVRSQATRIVAAARDARTPAALRAMDRAAKDLDAGQLIDLATARKDTMVREGQQPVFRFVERAVAEAMRTGVPYTIPDLARQLKKPWPPGPLSETDYFPCFVVANGPLTRTFLSNSVAISDGPIECKVDIGYSFVLASGDVRTTRVGHSFLFVDGNVHITREGVNGSIIICTGDIICTGPVIDSTLLARGEVAYLPFIARSTVASSQVTFFDKVRPFDLSRLGLGLTGRDGQAVVAKVDPASRFGKAGLQVGDRVTGVGPYPVASDAECLRRLRRELAEFWPFTLSVRRGDRTLELTVPAPAEP